jgi:hypothetical protein
VNTPSKKGRPRDHFPVIRKVDLLSPYDNSSAAGDVVEDAAGDAAGDVVPETCDSPFRPWLVISSWYCLSSLTTHPSICSSLSILPAAMIPVSIAWS